MHQNKSKRRNYINAQLTKITKKLTENLPPKAKQTYPPHYIFSMQNHVFVFSFEEEGKKYKEEETKKKERKEGTK